MSLDADVREPSDAELVSAVQAGDDAAFGRLWERHIDAARRLASQLTRPSNVDDLLSESFLRVLRAVRDGGGPDTAFRAYLFTTMRRYNIDTGRAYHRRVVPTDDPGILDIGVAESAGDVFSADAEGRAAWQAWESLPADSRTLLWHLVIEEEQPAEVATLLGVSANAVSSRAVRARERLRQAFLAQHLSQADNDECRRARARLGAYVRNALSARDRATVQEHLGQCRRCTAAVAELSDVNSALRLVIAPILLGGGAIAARYLAAAHHAAAAAAAGNGGVRRLGRRVGRPAKITAGVAAAAFVCGALALAYAASPGPQRKVADQNPPARAAGSATSSPPRPQIAVAPGRPVPRSGPAAIPTHHTAAPSPAPAPEPVPESSTNRPRRSDPRPRPATTTPARSTAAPEPGLRVTRPRPPSVSVPKPTPTPTPSGQVDLVQTAHHVTTDAGTPHGPGTLTVALPAAWTLTAISFPGQPDARCTRSAAEGRCTLTVDPSTTYPYTIEVVGPGADHESLLRLSFVDAAGNPIDASVPINP